MTEDSSPYDTLERIKNAQMTAESDVEHYDKSEKFVQAVLQWFFSEHNQDKKAYISSKNEQGIIEALSINEYLNKQYGFRNEILDKIVTEKIVKSVGVKGRGTESIIRFAQSFGMQVVDSNEEEGGLRNKLMRR